jgi:hypothetical protein
VKSWVLWIAVPAVLGTPPAAGEIFKCKTKGGADLYQNFPCELDSLGLPSPDASSSAAARPSSEPRRGMKPEEVRAIWGEPQQVIQDEPRSGRVEIWEYADGRSVRFNHKERVLSVER